MKHPLLVGLLALLLHVVAPPVSATEATEVRALLARGQQQLDMTGNRACNSGSKPALVTAATAACNRTSTASPSPCPVSTSPTSR
jgi:hypothetical protein